MKNTLQLYIYMYIYNNLTGTTPTKNLASGL